MLFNTIILRWHIILHHITHKTLIYNHITHKTLIYIKLTDMSINHIHIGEKLDYPYTNELVDGSIIDICGVIFLFQNPITMAKLIRKYVSTFFFPF